MSNKEQTRNIYDQYYKDKGAERNDLLMNPSVLFQNLASDVAMIAALRAINLNRENERIFDVGAGSGDSVERLLRLGFKSENIVGIDIIEERIQKARLTWPNVNFILGDARYTDFNDGMFDLTYSATTFLQITDDQLAKEIAREMLRVTRRGGWIIVSDWRYSKPGNKDYLAVSQKRIANLFEVGNSVSVHSVFNGALVPPVGRWFSKYAPSLYFLVQKLFPVLVGQQVTVLRRN